MLAEHANKTLLLLFAALLLLIFMDVQAGRHYQSVSGGAGGIVGKRYKPVRRKVKDVFGAGGSSLIPQTTGRAHPRQQEFELFFIRFRRGRTQLVRVRRRARNVMTPLECLQLLQQGPIPVERGLLTALGSQVRLRSVDVRDGTAYVDVGAGFTRNGPRLVRARIEQILMTLVQFQEIRDVQLSIQGRRVDEVAGVPVRLPDRRRILDYSE